MSQGTPAQKNYISYFLFFIIVHVSLNPLNLQASRSGTKLTSPGTLNSQHNIPSQPDFIQFVTLTPPCALGYVPHRSNFPSSPTHSESGVLMEKFL